MRQPGDDDDLPHDEPPEAFGATWFPGLYQPDAGEPLRITPAWFSHPIAPKSANRDALPLISLASFRNNQCSKATLIAVHALPLDVDDSSGVRSVQHLAELGCAALGGVRTTVASTWNHRPDAVRARLIHTLSRAVTLEEFAPLWTAVNIAYAAAGVTLDRACRDACHRFFVPAMPPSGHFECAQIEGEPLDVGAWIAAGTEWSTPPARVAPALAPAPVGTGRRAAYLRTAIEGEVAAVASAPKGLRNPTLNKAAYSLARHVDLPADVIKDALTSAAQAVGLGRGEIVRTIESAIRGRRGAA